MVRAALPLAFFIAVTASAEATAGQFQRVYASNSNASLTEWGRRYENGEGVVTDVNRAIRLYCKAANRGHAAAQYYLGWLYSRGRGVKRDDALAAAWFKKAARQNHVQARNLLGLLRVRPKSQTACPLGRRTGSRGMSANRLNAPPPHLAELVRTLAPRYGLKPELVLAVVRAESNFDPTARSPKNAQGLMQLVPETAARFGVKDVWDPEENLRGGMSYLRWLLDYFEGDIRLALAGYNAGEGAVLRYGGVPPFDETEDYVERITAALN